VDRHHRQQALTGRITAAPLLGGTFLHFGASASLRRPRDEVTQFAALPETVLLQDLQTASAPLALNHYQLGALEAAVLAASLMVRVESIVARMPGYADVRPFAGGYAEATWVFGAEPRGYDAARGTFTPVISSFPVFGGGAGALEFAARYSVLDMRSNALGDAAAAQGHPELQEVFSGQRSVIRSIGVNWYATDAVKLTLEGLGIAIDSRSSITHATVIQGRLQILFAQP
jgi:phosphate-selective porin